MDKSIVVVGEAYTRKEALIKIAKKEPDTVIIDYGTKKRLTLLDDIKELGFQGKVIVLNVIDEKHKKTA